MFEFFPGDYAWSQGALRAMFVGGSPGEVLRAVGLLGTTRDRSPEAWNAIWVAVASEVVERAEAQAAAGHIASAASSFLRAAICLQWAPAFMSPADPVRLDEHRRSVEWFARFAALHEPALEHREVPYERASCPAWLVRPPGRGRDPVVVYFPGWDSTKEQGIGLALSLAERGIATLLWDGPGIGEAVLFRGLVNRHDYEVAGAAALASLLDDGDDLDTNRIGVVGSSLGSYRAARFAAFEPRIRAAVLWGAVWNFGHVWRRNLERPGSGVPTPDSHALHVMGAASVGEVTTLLDLWTLEPVAAQIRCPILILHGGSDTQFSESDARRLFEAVGSADRRLRIYPAGTPGSAHCQNDNRVLAHEDIGDWLADRLVHRSRNDPATHST